MTRVCVETAELSAAMAQLRKAHRRGGAEAVWRIDRRGLTLEWGGAEVRLGRGARGEAEARLDGKTFYDLAEVLPPVDEFWIEIGVGFLRIDTVKFRAVTTGAVPTREAHGVSERLLETLLAGYAPVSTAEDQLYTEHEHFEAQKEKERLVREAGVHLGVLGISDAQLRDFVEEHLVRLALGPRRRRKKPVASSEP